MNPAPRPSDAEPTQPSAAPVARLAEIIRQGGAFAVIGLLATATHAGAALGSETAFGLAPLSANFIGYCTAVGVSYFGHTWITFRQPAMQGGQFLRFVVVSLSGLGLNQAIVYLTTHLAGWPLWAALIPATLLVPAFTFVLSKLWAFRAKGAAAPSSGGSRS